MSKKTIVAFFALFAAFAAFAADDDVSAGADSSVTKQSAEAKEAKAAGKADAVKSDAKKDSAEAAKPAEKKDSAEVAKPAEKKDAGKTDEKTDGKKKTEIGASDLSIGDVTAVLSGMLPMVGESGLFSKDDAVKAFQDLLKLYRDASPEERQQVVLAVTMMQGVISTLSISSGMLLQQMEPEDREQLVESATSTVKILSEAQKEVTAKMTEDEKKVFGGLFQSLQSFCESFLKAAKK